MRQPFYSAQELADIAGIRLDEWGNWRRAYPSLRSRDDIIGGQGRVDAYTGSTVFAVWAMARLSEVGLRASEAAEWAVALRPLAAEVSAVKRKASPGGRALLFLNPVDGVAQVLHVTGTTTFGSWPAAFRGKSCIFVMDLAGLPDLEP